MLNSPSDGIGRHAGFRNQCLKHEGSSPSEGNKKVSLFFDFPKKLEKDIVRLRIKIKRETVKRLN